MQWRNVRIIAGYEYRSNFRRGGFLFATFGLPVLGALIVLGLRWLAQQPGRTDLIVVDPDKPIGVLDQAHMLPPDLPAGFAWAQSEAQGKQAVAQGEWLALVVIPPGYAPPESPLRVYVTPGASFTETLERRVTALLLYARLADHMTPADLALLLEPLPMETITVAQAEERAQDIGTSMSAYVLSIVYFMALFSSAGYLLQSVAQEKESRMVEVLLSSVTTAELLWGKMVGLTALGMTQLAVWAVTATRLLAGEGDAWTLGWDASTLAVAVPALILGYWLFALLMAGLGALGNNLRESQQFGAFVSMLGVLPLMAGSLYFFNPNGLVPRVLTFIPWTAPLSLLLRVSLAVVPRWEVAAAFASMLAGVVFSAWAGVRLFRVGILMMGKKPSWKEVWHILRNPA